MWNIHTGAIYFWVYIVVLLPPGFVLTLVLECWTMAFKRKITGTIVGGVVGTLDVFLSRAESVLMHVIQITEKRLSLGSLIGQKRSSFGAITTIKSPECHKQVLECPLPDKSDPSIVGGFCYWSDW